MKYITIYENRKLSQSSLVIGYLNENNAEQIKFDIPEIYKKYNKKACFRAGNDVFALLLENDVLTITQSVTKYNDLDMTIEFFDTTNKDEIIFKTSMLKLKCLDAVTNEDIVETDPKKLILDTLISDVNKAIAETNNLDLDVDNSTLTLTKKDGTKKEVNISTGGTGGTGKDGKSAYEIAKENGFEGTETEWLASLKGQKGDNGTNGQNGENGATYTPSVDNLGNLSWTNDKGLTNPNTVNIKGANGSNGTDGKNGKDGTSATVTVGTVTTGDAGSSASVTNSGTENNAILNFVIPKGDKGENGTSGTEGITSTAITSIQVVDSLPETEETGVLYLVKEGTTPAVVNLYPTQNSITNTENGCTITHNNKQVTINGTPTSSTWGWTNHFTMPLESGKNYVLKLTNAGGTFDNSGRIAAGSDDVVIKVLIYAYLADNTEVALVNKELTDTTIYNAQQFLCGDTYKDYYFSIQAKSNVAFNNLVLDVEITEV